MLKGICINEDPTEFFMVSKDEAMTEELLRARMDLYNNRDVKEIFLCPGAMRSSFKSKVTEAYWDNIDSPIENINIRYVVQNTRKCYERKLNPYSIWIEHIRENNQSPWLSMRMNDVHNVDEPNHVLHNSFWKDNPQFRRAPYRTCWEGQALDYGRKEVRERALNIIKEYLKLFSPDGLELDWMRFRHHFRPGFESAGREQLNDLLREVRYLTTQKGIQLGVRVPPRPHDAFRMGFDIYTWSDEKLIDRLVTTPFWASSDYDLPIEEWTRILNKNILLCAGIEIISRINEEQTAFFNTDEIIFGYAANFLGRGADRLYLFNHMAGGPTGMYNKNQFVNVMNNAGHMENLKGHNRRHVITYTDARPIGIKYDNILPADLPPKGFAEFRIPTGLPPDLDQSCELLLGFPEENAFNKDLRIWINAQEITPAVPHKSIKEVPGDVASLLSWNIDNKLLNSYDNVIEIYNFNQAENIKLNWCELYYHA